MHPFQLLDLLPEHVFSCLRPFFGFRFLLHVHHFSVVGIPTQLFLDAFQLLLKKIIPLLLIELRFCFSGHFILELGKLQFTLQKVHQLFRPRPEVIRLQQFLLLFKVSIHIGTDEMHEETRVLDVL